MASVPSSLQDKSKNILLSLLPILLLLSADYAFLWFTPTSELIMSHFIFAVLLAQSLFQLIFFKGQLCNGQRHRLSKFNLFFLIFWIIWLILSLLQVNAFVPLRLAYCCGILLTITTWQQPKEKQLRHSVLLLGALVAGLGFILALFPLVLQNLNTTLIYNPFWQANIAIALCYWGLIVARSRLQVFISLLPLIATILLLTSAIFAAGSLFYLYLNKINIAEPIFISGYFIGHLILLALWAIPLLQQKPLSLSVVLVILGIASILPILFY
ncbi:hypothetical protein CEP48_04475 [Mergibacter septicus]|uniref:Uncharacterized protein n=1 Tax=Mergibacter septicus TaxID=221402 RepID=A0A8D4LNW5_9PAST|nr:hypothetical protein [Mergibacter septicus]AWX15471.1 hypothetical protein CEP47_04480 [Mergibacter septicus]QDJ14724.1 hypothetical protein CEP48_04475 [Mergibacter septicus]UTU47849.1 hypothetical protein HLL31_03125 [Mergibacter septicus]WMR96545.1 hypothetical protein RDJ12_03025 [Mergibacter septicus]